MLDIVSRETWQRALSCKYGLLSFTVWLSHLLETPPSEVQVVHLLLHVIFDDRTVQGGVHSRTRGQDDKIGFP